MLGQPVGIERLHGAHDPLVEDTSPLLKEAAVCHVLSERVLERVLDLWKEAGLVEELRRLKSNESSPKRVIRYVGDRFQQRERDVLANDGCGLQQPLVLRLQAINAGRHDRLRRRWNLETLGCFL